MKPCLAAGAGTMLFFWIVGFVVADVFERQLGELAGFAIIVMMLVGAWAGIAVRAECRARHS